MGMKERMVRFRSFWIFPLLSVALLVLSYRSYSQHPGVDLVKSLTAGVVIWTLLEYIFHRFLLHAEFRSATLRAFVNESHLNHHAAPRDRDQILVKPMFALVTSGVIYAVLLAISRDLYLASGTMTGIWLGFLYYEAVHYRVHLSLVHSAILNQQRRAHFYHHFSDSQKCYGVTSPV